MIYQTLTILSKIDYNSKVKDIENKCFTTSDYVEFANDILDAKPKEK